MSTATRMWPLAGAYWGADKSSVHFGDSGPISMPLPVFLIEHERGLVLIDTGLSPKAWDVGPENVHPELSAMYPFECPEENRLDRQIAKAGFATEDITHVVISHSHIDHTGGISMFPHAQFYISHEELTYARNPLPFYQSMFGTADLDAARDYAWNILTTDHDLFGDGAIQLLQTPGHTPGQISTLVRLPGQAVLIVGDAAHTHTNMAGVPCPVDLDTTQAYLSVERIKQIAAAEQATIWVMHDLEQWNALGASGAPLS